MYHRLAALLLLLAFSAGCATDHGRIVGPGADPEIGDALRAGDLREVVVVHGERAYWIGADALRTETEALIDALVSEPQTGYDESRPSPVTEGPHLTLRNVGADDVLVFRHPTSFVDIGFDRGRGDEFVRVVRVPIGDTTMYDLWMFDADRPNLSRRITVEESPSIASRWATLVQETARRADPMFVQFHASTEHGPRATTYLRESGIEIQRLVE